MLSLSAQAFPLIQPWEFAGIYFIYLFIFPLWQFLLACSLPKGQLMLSGWDSPDQERTSPSVLFLSSL